MSMVSITSRGSIRIALVKIDRALRDLHIVPGSQPGVPQNNAVATRLVQDILEGARTALLRAGLPPCFWEYACRRYCALANALPVRKSASADGGRSSPREKTHEEPFPGRLIPIGSKAIFKPSETKQDSPSKMDPAAITGVSAGYELASGCRWNCRYMVWSLEDFATIDLSTKSLSLSIRYSRPHKTKVVDLLDEEICFPLKSE